MFQQITPVFFDLQLHNPFSKPRNLGKRIFLLFVVLTSFSGLNARPVPFEFSALDSGLKMASDTSIEASICAGQTYFFDGQSLFIPGEYTATYLGSDGSDSVVTLLLTVLPISVTNLQATICEGESYAFNGQDLSQSGNYTVTLPAENGCDSIVTLQLTILPPIKTSLGKAICIGTNYVFQGDTLTESGLYSIVLTSSNGCDSIVDLNLNVVPFFQTTLNASICPGQTYEFAGAELTDAGVYTDTLTAIGGCDSILLLNLSIRPTITSSLYASICNGASYNFNGDLLTDSGSYQAVFTGYNGCDSTVVLKLDVVDFYNIQLEGTICTGEFYYFDGDLLDTEGVYTYEYTAQGGCDSTVTFTLQVLPVSSGAGSATICAGDQYDYNGEILTAEGVYTFVLEAANGCDSTVTFTLNVLPAIGSTLEASICKDETYAFEGQILDSSGTYEALFTAVNGCDSVVTLELTVLPLHASSLSAAICAGESYDYNGELLTVDGSYLFVLSGENGCDSTVTLVLTVYPAQNTILNLNICQGETYEFDGTLIADAGTYTAVFTSENGCDSTVTLVLGVLPIQNTILEATICANETYPFNGGNLNTAGTYTAVLTGANGCDSTLVLTLSVLPTQSNSIFATICQGTSYEYNGLSLNTAGDFEFVFEGENGCDSTVTVTVTILPAPTTSITATICEGAAYDYNGEILTDAGDYSFVFDAINGCDSIVTVSLTVTPLQTSTTAAALCVGSAYVFNGDTLTESGIYPYVFAGSNGCDSIATLVLEFVSSFETHLQASICAGEFYVFGDDSISASGDYSLLLAALGGCDSTLNLSLTVLPLSESSTNVSICAGESYEFNGTDFNTSGTYNALLTSANGCDSTAILHLTVLPLLNSTVEAIICANETYAFNGQILSDAGTYTAVVTGSNGCDSTVVLTLNVLPTQSSSLSASICANQTYDFNGQILSQSGTYTAVLQGENGCDSTITLNLEVLPLVQSAFAALVCNGEPFEYNGQVLIQSGEYQFVYPGAGINGCDSVETLFLTIFPAIPPIEIFAFICEGDSYDFYGTILTASGTYSIDQSTPEGCDYTIVLTLLVSPKVETNTSATICAGDSYPFNGQNLTAAGTYTALFQTSTGCDSTVVLTLSVNTVNSTAMLQGGTITTQATNATFQWLNCATNQLIPGETENFYTPQTTGNYAVVVTQNGCTATSSCVFVQVVSTNEPLAEQAWTLQPNPATTHAQIVFADKTAENLWLEIHDMAGRMLFSQLVTPGTSQIDLNLNNMPDGILVVRLTDEKGVSAKRLMKAEH